MLIRCITIFCWLFILNPVFAQIPPLLNYQGRLFSGGAPYTGPAEMKFALVGPGGTPVFWRNDGLVSAGEPATSVSVTVESGLLMVNLGDTNLPNMARFPVGLFSQPDVRVRIWVNAGTNSFTQLTPDQRITSVGYAFMAADVLDGVITSAKLGSNAIQSFHLSSNSVTAAQIASNTITATHLVAGSITSNQLAAGTVGSGQLAKPYQSGTLSLSGLFPFGNFSSYLTTQTVTFATPFSVPPVITTSLESPHRGAIDLINPISIRQKTATTFALTFRVPTAPLTVASSGSIDDAPMAMVNGYPALIYRRGNNLLQFVRSTDANGFRWPVGSLISTGVTTEVTMKVVNNQPAVAYLDTSNSIRFLRANDSSGSNWPAVAQTIATSNLTFRPSDLVLSIINGHPAVAVQDFIGKDIVYFRALDSNGVTWPGVGSQVATGNVGIALAEVNGRPAISFGWDNGLSSASVSYQAQLRYIQATDTNGTSWPVTPLNIINDGPFSSFQDTHLLIVGGNPAIMCRYSMSGGISPVFNCRFYKGHDVNGTLWSFLSVITGPGTPGGFHAALVNGRPAAAFYDYDQRAMRYAESNNNGTNFFNSFVYREIDNSFPHLLVVGGRPAITFSNPDVQELWYIRDANPTPDTFINWIAVQP